MSEVAKLETGIHGILHTAGTALPELFVINLCASMTPIPALPKTLKGFEKYKLYQVSRQEDGRRRFRLRLGFFTSEADAEWVLNSVRSLYPTAFTGCLTQEDLRFTGGDSPQMAAAIAAAPAPNTPPAEPATRIKPAAHTTTSTVSQAPAATIKTPPALPVKLPAPSPAPGLSLETPAVPKSMPAAQTQTYAPAFHVARGIELPETHLELTDEHQILSVPATPPTMPAKPAAAPPRSAAATPGHAVRSASGTPVAAQTTVAAGTRKGPVHSASIVTPPKTGEDDYVPILDTTLTIRTLTQSEAEDPNRPKWFVVQLALSEQPINLDTMPKLDIFAAYRLYCVALMEGGSIRHALRLGFFRENVSAEAVMGYLKAFFPTPGITQISSAEQERFAEPKLQPRPVTEPAAKVVSLSDKRMPPAKAASTTSAPLPQAQPAPRSRTGTTASAAPAKDSKSRMAPPVRTQSFLSRLIGRQLD